MSKRPERQPPPPPDPLSPLIDAHTHLDACGARTPDDVRAIADRAQSVGVQAMVTIADDLASAHWAADASEWDERVYAAVALHPTRAGTLAGPKGEAARAQIGRHEDPDRRF